MYSSKPWRWSSLLVLTGFWLGPNEKIKMQLYWKLKNYLSGRCHSLPVKLQKWSLLWAGTFWWTPETDRWLPGDSAPRGSDSRCHWDGEGAWQFSTWFYSFRSLVVPEASSPLAREQSQAASVTHQWLVASGHCPFHRTVRQEHARSPADCFPRVFASPVSQQQLR